MNEFGILSSVHDHPHPRVVIAGGSGFLGRLLADHFTARGMQVIVLSRNPNALEPWTCPATLSDTTPGTPASPTSSAPRSAASTSPASPLIQHLAWDGRSPGPWTAALEGAAALINLCGRSVDCVKTPDHRDEILRSRVESTRALGIAVRSLERPPPVWVQMSTAHIYGDPPCAICDEDSTPGIGLAPEVGQAWEAAFRDAAPPYVRRVVLRTSFVLGRDRGAGASALGRLARLAKHGLGGTVGHGRQGVSWIHELDLARLFEYAVLDPGVRGTYVATAPHPVSNAEFMRELRRTLRVPIGLPAPAPLVRLAAPLVLRTDPELALYGRYCVPTRLLREGFQFRFPALPEALADLLSRPPRPRSAQDPDTPPHRAVGSRSNPARDAAVPA